MAKNKKAVDVAEITKDGGMPIPDKVVPELIEQFIIGAGSDSVKVFGGQYEGGIHCQQAPDEFAAFIKHLLDSGETIRAYLEIGAAAGGTTYIINHFFKPERIVLIDSNAHPKSSLRPAILEGIDRQEIIGCSRDPEVIAQAGYVYDLIIIDGERTYEGVSADAKNFAPLVRAGGFIAIHDSTLKARGITQAVDELREDHGLEFVEEFMSTKRAPLGIALFRKAAE